MTLGIKKINGMWDAHNHYKTVYHTHMSYLSDNDYLIDLSLVKCQDGRWFIIDDTGEIQDSKLLNKYSEQFNEPEFFENEEQATEYALKVINSLTGVSISDLRVHFSE